MITSIEFLRRHSYSVKDMTEKQAEQFIINNGTGKFAVFNYMKKRARFLIERKDKLNNKSGSSE